MSFLSFAFMRNALAAVIISSFIFAALGTLVVNKKMAFFSDAIGHSALAGIAAGMIFGLTDLSVSTVIFAVGFALLLNFVKDRTSYGADTIISVFASVAMSAGLVILSTHGSFAGYSSYLLGDILSITKGEVIMLASCLVLVLVFWIAAFNGLCADSINRALAGSKGIRGKVYDYVFSAFLAVVIMISIRWIGILLINSLIILPAASSRNIVKSTRMYHLLSVIISIVCGVTGLILSFYLMAPTGPLIVLLLGGSFFITFAAGRFVKD